MALRDTLNNLAATATTMANSAIETGKLNLKISAEEKKIAAFTLSIGELLVDQLDAGEVFDDEIMALYGSIQAARQVIADAKAELGSNRPVDVIPHCTACGAELADNAKFCSNCGAKVEDPIVEVVETEPVPCDCQVSEEE